MLDTFHMNIEETSISAAIRTAGKLLGHFHTGECNRMAPGQGRMPWREIGYDGAIVMAPFVSRGGQIERGIRIWHDLRPGATIEQLDRDARDSVAFERFMFEAR